MVGSSEGLGTTIVGVVVVVGVAGGVGEVMVEAGDGSEVGDVVGSAGGEVSGIAVVVAVGPNGFNPLPVVRENGGS